MAKELLTCENHWIQPMLGFFEFLVDVYSPCFNVYLNRGPSATYDSSLCHAFCIALAVCTCISITEDCQRKKIRFSNQKLGSLWGTLGVLEHLGLLEQKNGDRVCLGLHELRRNNKSFRRGCLSWAYGSTLLRISLEPLLRHLGPL